MAACNFASAMLLLCGTISVVLLWKFLTQDENSANAGTDLRAHNTVASDYYDIQPLDSFDIEETEPLQLRPWKPKYHLSMGLQQTSFSEFLPINRTLSSRLALRRQIIAEHGKMVVGANEVVLPAVKEFYAWLVGTYLPGRYPSMYSRREGALRCLKLGTSISLEPPADVNEILRTIAMNIDAEFFFVQRQGDVYVARGFINCYPFTFDTRHKLNKTLAQIHGTVPGFKAKLQKSMDRYFTSLPKGKIVKRHSWNIALDSCLYSPGTNPLRYLPTYTMVKIRSVLEFLRIGFPKMKKEDIDPDQVTVRCERQTLHRLMENDDTIVFTFQTYQYPLRQIHEEGSGESLSEAIMGIKGGSVPELEWYKASPYYEDAIAEFMRH